MIKVKPCGRMWYAERDGRVLAWGSTADEALGSARVLGAGYVAPALIFPRRPA